MNDEIPESEDSGSEYQPFSGFKLEKSARELELHVEERQNDIDSNSSYIRFAFGSSIIVFMVAVFFTVWLFTTLIERQQLIGDAISEKSQVFSACTTKANQKNSVGEVSAQGQAADSNPVNATTSTKSGQKHTLQSSQSSALSINNPSNTPAFSKTKLQRGQPKPQVKPTGSCEQLSMLGALINGSGVSLTPFIALNTFLYLIALFIFISIGRVRYSIAVEEQRELKEVFSPILEVIKEIIDYLRSSKN